MLTKKQHQLLIYINRQLSINGVSPSYDEMKDAIGLRSKSGVHRLVLALEERGFLRRLINRARALEVLKMPPQANSANSPANNNVPMAANMAANMAENMAANMAANDDNIDIPIMGRIAAGVPIEAIQNRMDSISVAPSLLKTGEHFALEVQGDSMVDEGILEGDIVLIQRSPTATQGDIVVALVENEEATLKRFKQEGNKISLEPANQNYETKTYDSDKIEVQGCLVGLVRKY